MTALAAILVAGSAEAATMTFDWDSGGVPISDSPDSPAEGWQEDGITAVADGEIFYPGEADHTAAHMDDAGTPNGSQITFTMDSLFDASSISFASGGWNVQRCIDELSPECSPLIEDNMILTGYRDGVLVAEMTFFLGGAAEYLFGEAFSSLDRLVLSFLPNPDQDRIYLADGSYIECSFNAPCADAEVDGITLAPVPLPASAALLAGAIGLLGLVRRRRA